MVVEAVVVVEIVASVSKFLHAYDNPAGEAANAAVSAREILGRRQWSCESSEAREIIRRG